MTGEHQAGDRGRHALLRARQVAQPLLVFAAKIIVSTYVLKFSPFRQENL
jgi:hypothetical protein